MNVNWNMTAYGSSMGPDGADRGTMFASRAIISFLSNLLMLVKCLRSFRGGKKKLTLTNQDICSQR